MLHQRKLPTFFSIVEKGDTTVFVKEEYKELILHMISDTESLHDRYKDNSNIKFGRGSYISIPITKNREERFIIRDYRHGGLLGKLFGKVFCDGNRPLNEIYINEIASLKGVPSAEVIAITKRKLWWFFYKANFITKEIYGAVDIAQFLNESSLKCIQRYKKSIIFALVRLIRNMHDAGIYHADLHIKNILLKKDSNGEFNAYIIDLDKSVVLNNLNINRRIKNLLRLDRSLEKLRWFSGENYQFNVPVFQSNAYEEEMEYVSMNQKIDSISKTDRIRFFKYYMLYDNALDRDWKRYIRQYQSQHSMHKLWWRILSLSRK